MERKIKYIYIVIRIKSMKFFKKNNILTRKKLKKNLKYNIKNKGGGGKTKKIKIKNHIIFDLDETLIQTRFLDSSTDTSDSSSDMEQISNISQNRNQVVTPNKDLKYTIGKILYGDRKDQYIIYHRPYLKKILDYCYKNYNVSIWTAATQDYCKMVLNSILTKEQYNKTKIIFARKGFREFKVVDVRNRKIQKTKFVDGDFSKNLSYLWNHPKYKKFVSINSSFIVDDKILVKHENKENGILILPWNYYNLDDDKLLKLLKWLKKNKNTSDIRQVDKPKLY